MAGKISENLKTELELAKTKGDSITLKDPVPVVVNLDNGETYKGFAYEARPNGLIMVQTGNCDLGVQLSSITKA